MMKISKLLKVGAFALLAASLCFVSCKDEDENDTLDGYSISYGHPSDADTTYSRSWNVTHTNHVSANATITIDRTSLTTNGTKGLKTSTSTSGDSSATGNNAAYIFGLTGSGTADKPYSFGLCGFRLKGTTPQYFISWYTGVLSSDCNSDENDFDTATNTAYEYIIQAAWTDLPADSYTLTDNALIVYINLDAMSGSTAVTADNYSSLKGTINGYRIQIQKNSTATTGVTKTFTASNVTKDTSVKTSVPDLAEFNIDQTRLGFYAMVSKGNALVAKLDFDNDSIVRSAISDGAKDDFGMTIDLDGEFLTNIK